MAQAPRAIIIVLTAFKTIKKTQHATSTGSLLGTFFFVSSDPWEKAWTVSVSGSGFGKRA